MANFNESMKILMDLEFNSPSNALHKNKTEDGYTYMGIYQKAHPKWEGWVIVREYIEKFKDLKIASKNLYKNEHLTNLVYFFYKRYFWDIAQMDLLNSQKIASEIFIFGVNAGMPIAIKKAQKLVGSQCTGYIGKSDIDVLNLFNEDIFDVQYDLLEREYYNYLIAKNPKLKIYANGWRNRSVAV